MSEHSSSIAVLLKRLEAATTRLEDIAFRTKKPAPPIPSEANIASPSSAPAPVERSAPSASAVVPPSVTAYDNIINGSFKEFLSLSQSIDPTLLSQVSLNTPS
jgi:adenylyl cyclase-associated protein